SQPFQWCSHPRHLKRRVSHPGSVILPFPSKRQREAKTGQHQADQERLEARRHERPSHDTVSFGSFTTLEPCTTGGSRTTQVTSRPSSSAVAIGWFACRGM